MRVAYEGFTIDGQAVNGTLAAGDREQARKQLREQGIFATRLSDARDAAGGRGSRVSRDALATIFRQLSVLISTGTPLVEALQAVERQSDGQALVGVVAALRRRVEEGSAFSDALAAMPETFDPICRTMAAAGEAAGMLERMLADLAELYRREARIRKAVVGALTYPAIVITASLVVLAGLVTLVLPKFQSMFDAIQAPVPAATAWLMAVGTAVRDHWAVVLLALGVLVTGAVVAVRSAAVRRQGLEASLSLPIVGPLVRSLSTAQLVRCLGLLLESKVTLLDSIKLAGDSMSHPVYAALLARAHDAVSRGEPLAQALDDPRCIGPSVRQAIASGERSGKLGAVLTQVSKHLDEDNEIIVRGLARSIEPVLLAALGILIGVVAISLFLPLFDVAASASAGGSR